MAWRKQATHREETAVVKAALSKAGIPFRKVGHGSGTAWGWLDIYLAEPWAPGPQETDRRVVRLAQEVTGRSGGYDGDISVHYA